MPWYTYVYAWGFFPVLALVVVYAWVRGGAVERIVAAMFCLTTIAETIARSRPAPDSLDPLTAAIDLALLAGLLTVLLRYKRLWLVFATSFQMLSTLGHLAMMMAPTSGGLGYAILIGSGGYPCLIAIALGTRSIAKGSA